MPQWCVCRLIWDHRQQQPPRHCLLSSPEMLSLRFPYVGCPLPSSRQVEVLLLNEVEETPELLQCIAAYDQALPGNLRRDGMRRAMAAQRVGIAAVRLAAARQAAEAAKSGRSQGDVGSDDALAGAAAADGSQLRVVDGQLQLLPGVWGTRSLPGFGRDGIYSAGVKGRGKGQRRAKPRAEGGREHLLLHGGYKCCSRCCCCCQPAPALCDTGEQQYVMPGELRTVNSKGRRPLASWMQLMISFYFCINYHAGCLLFLFMVLKVPASTSRISISKSRYAICPSHPLSICRHTCLLVPVSAAVEGAVEEEEAEDDNEQEEEAPVDAGGAAGGAPAAGPRKQSGKDIVSAAQRRVWQSLLVHGCQVPGCQQRLHRSGQEAFTVGVLCSKLPLIPVLHT